VRQIKPAQLAFGRILI